VSSELGILPAVPAFLNIEGMKFESASEISMFAAELVIHQRGRPSAGIDDGDTRAFRLQLHLP
jgi:hypothetical protein